MGCLIHLRQINERGFGSNQKHWNEIYKTMKKIILAGLLSTICFAVIAQSPNGITPGSGGSGGNGVSAFTNPSSTQVDTLTITLDDGTTKKVTKPKYMVLSNAAPVGAAVAISWMDTLDADTLFVNNLGVWERMQPPVVDGAQIYYATNAALTTFYPNNTPPVGAVIENPFLGNLMRKYSGGIFSVTAPNGRNIREQERYFQFNNLTTWNLNTHAAATLSLDPGTDGTMGAPLNLTAQQRGNEWIVVIVNQDASPRTVTFNSVYREQSGLTSLTPLTVVESSDLTLSFTIDTHDGDVIMRLNSAVTAPIGPTNLTLTGSGPVTLNSSTGADVTFTQGANVTLTRTGNDLTIAATGGSGGATDLTWTGSGPYTLVSSTGTDVTVTQGANMTITRVGNDLSFASAAGTPTVTGINDVTNGFDPTLTGTLIGGNYDFDELPDDLTYNGTEMFIFKDLIDGNYKKATTSFLALGYVALTGAQTVNGVKTFASSPILSSLTASLPVKTLGDKSLTAAAINLASAEVTGILPPANGGSEEVAGKTNVTTTVGGLFTISHPYGSNTNVKYANAVLVSANPAWYCHISDITVSGQITWETLNLNTGAQVPGASFDIYYLIKKN